MVLQKEMGSSWAAACGTLEKLASHPDGLDPKRVSAFAERAAELSERPEQAAHADAFASRRSRARRRSCSRSSAPRRTRSSRPCKARALSHALVPRRDGLAREGGVARGLPPARPGARQHRGGRRGPQPPVRAQRRSTTTCRGIPMRLEQRIGRVHRLGQEHPVRVDQPGRARHHRGVRARDPGAQDPHVRAGRGRDGGDPRRLEHARLVRGRGVPALDRVPQPARAQEALRRAGAAPRDGAQALPAAARQPELAVPQATARTTRRRRDDAKPATKRRQGRAGAQAPAASPACRAARPQPSSRSGARSWAAGSRSRAARWRPLRAATGRSNSRRRCRSAGAGSECGSCSTRRAPRCRAARGSPRPAAPPDGASSRPRSPSRRSRAAPRSRRCRARRPTGSPACARCAASRGARRAWGRCATSGASRSTPSSRAGAGCPGRSSGWCSSAAGGEVLERAQAPQVPDVRPREGLYQMGGGTRARAARALAAERPRDARGAGGRARAEWEAGGRAAARRRARAARRVLLGAHRGGGGPAAPPRRATTSTSSSTATPRRSSWSGSAARPRCASAGRCAPRSGSGALEEWSWPVADLEQELQGSGADAREAARARSTWRAAGPRCPPARPAARPRRCWCARTATSPARAARRLSAPA